MSEVKRFYAPGLDCMYRDNKDAPRELIPMVLAAEHDAAISALQSRLDAAEQALKIAQSDIKVEQRVSANLRQHKTDYMEASEQTRKALEKMVSERDAVLRDARELIAHGNFETGLCCCGGSVDRYGMGDGHSPVDEGSYYAGSVSERIDALLSSAEPVSPQPAQGVEGLVEALEQIADARETPTLGDPNVLRVIAFHALAAHRQAQRQA